MKKEKVYIVVSHKHVLQRAGSKTVEAQWGVEEKVEFVNQLRNRHYTSSSAIGDYINRKMESGKRYGMGDYDKFESYVREKYKKEMAELDKAYRPEQIEVAPVEEVSPEAFADQFGNIRERTVFDKESV